MNPGLGGYLDLGPNTIVCGNQNWIGETRGFQIENPAKSADFCVRHH